MPADYEAIEKEVAEDLLRPRSRRTQIALYADPAHVVYELLQNADDHGATQISFQLLPDRLVVQHNATERFERKHIKAITSFEDSTSQNELLKTGTFGLGFKSVFAFTATPRVYCGDVNFEIYNLYQLRELEPPSGLDPEDTRFELPFNHFELHPEFVFEHDLKAPHDAARRITNKFEALEDITLLFTRTLKAIDFASKGMHRRWRREPNGDRTVTISTFHGQQAGLPVKESTFQRYEKAIKWKGEECRPVQIAVAVGEDGTPKLCNETLVVTFPTSIATGMGIVLNGPYRTNPARSEVGEGDLFNDFLVKQTSELLSDVLLDKRDANTLTLAFLELLPLDSSTCSKPKLLASLYGKTSKMLVDEELLPAKYGGYVAGKNAKIARGANIAELFGDQQLTALYEAKERLRWVTTDVTEDSTPLLYQVLAGGRRFGWHPFEREKGLIKEIVVRPEQLYAKLTRRFLEAQTDEWISTLYCTLHDKRTAPRAKSAAKKCPIIRLCDGSHVSPETNGVPNAFLPTMDDSPFSTVSKNVLQRPEAVEFLKFLGFTKPGVVAEVSEVLVPRYRSAMPVELEDHVDDVRLVQKGLNDVTTRSKVLKALEGIAFLRCRAGGSSEVTYKRPNEAYLATNSLGCFFDENSDAWLMSEEYSTLADYDSVIVPAFIALGVRAEYPTEHNAFGAKATVILRNERGDNERGLRGFHPEWNVDGLAFALGEPTLPRACFIWNELLPTWKHRIAGVIESSPQQSFPSDRTDAVRKTSVAGKLLTSMCWIPDSRGEFKAAKDIGSVSHLHPDLIRDEELLVLLDESASTKEQAAARTLEMPLDIADFVRRHLGAVEKLREVIESQEAHRETIEDTPLRKRDRRRQRLKERKEQAPSKESVKKLRSVPGHSAFEIDRQSLFDFYRDDEEALFCQMCLDPMPFVKRNDEECGECVALLTKGWADETRYDLKVLTSLNVVLCPVCSEIYREYVHKDIGKQTALFEHLTNGHDDDFAVCESGVRRDGKGNKLHFNQTHLGDIQDCLDSEDDSASDDD